MPPTGPLWAEACSYASDVLNMTARVRNRPDMLSSYQTLYGRAPFPRLLPFTNPGFHHVERTHKAEPKAEACFYLNIGSNPVIYCCKILLRPAADRTFKMSLRNNERRRSLGCCLRRGEKDSRRHRRRGGYRNPRNRRGSG